MADLEQKLTLLKQRGAEFQDTMRDLLAVRDAVKQDPKAFAEWQKLILDGNGIRSAIETAGRMIDGARRWTSRVFQVDAVSKIPFASDVVVMTTGGAISAIEHFIDRVHALSPKFLELQAKFKKLPEAEQKKLGEMPAPVKSQSIWPALILVGVLGGLVLFGDKFTGEFDDEAD